MASTSMKSGGLETGANGSKLTTKGKEIFPKEIAPEVCIDGMIFTDMQSTDEQQCKDLFVRLCYFHKFIPICFANTNMRDSSENVKFTAAMAYEMNEIKEFQKEFIETTEDNELTFNVATDFGLYSHSFLTEMNTSVHSAIFHLLERYRLVYESLQKDLKIGRSSMAIHNDYPLFQKKLEAHYTKEMLHFSSLDELELILSCRGF